MIVANTHKVVIDIGHGINTYPPAKGWKGFAEFTFNNAVGKKARELALVNGFEVLLTQPFDSKEVPLRDRVAQIRVQKPDMGVSIHANAVPSNPTVTGHEFWYWHTKEHSKKLATFMDANAVALLPNNRRGLKVSSPAKGKNFAILREVNSPMVIAEFGFFTNDYEREQLLMNEDFQFQCAKVVVKSFCDFVGKEFKVRETFRKPEPPPLWKVEGLQNLHKLGLVDDYEGWIEKLDEPAPAWLVFTMVDRLNRLT